MEGYSIYAALLYPVLVAGFIIANLLPSKRYNSNWANESYAYTSLIFFGFICFILAFSSVFVYICYVYKDSGCLVSLPILCAHVIEYFELMVKSNDLACLIIISLTTVIFSGIWILLEWASIYLNGFFLIVQGGYKFGILSAIRYIRLVNHTGIVASSPFDSMTLSSFINFCPVMISLDSAKVYVGYVDKLCEPETLSHNAAQEISITPVMSGFRDTDHRIVFNNSYNQARQSNGHPLSIAIPRGKIMSLSFFDFNVYMKVHGIEVSASE